MRSRERFELHCVDPTCDGWSGVECVYTGDTWTDPGWVEPDECPHCHNQLLEAEERIDAEAVLDQLLDNLDERNLLPSSLTIDAQRLLRVVLTELRRQAAEQKHARVWTPDAVAAVNAAINREFPPHDPPAWLTEGATR